jgi:hypothetical protein
MLNFPSANLSAKNPVKFKVRQVMSPDILPLSAAIGIFLYILWSLSTRDLTKRKAIERVFKLVVTPHEYFYQPKRIIKRSNHTVHLFPPWHLLKDHRYCR